MENSKTFKGVGYNFNYREIVKQDENLFLLMVHHKL